MTAVAGLAACNRPPPSARDATAEHRSRSHHRQDRANGTRVGYLHTMRPSLLLMILVLAAGCGDTRTGGGDGATPRVDTGPPCDLPQSQGPGEPCCPSHGPDACGAGSTCAALDGRTIATCYANGSRLDGDTCTADVQCSSGSCNLTASACRTQGLTCNPTIGCAPRGGVRAACAPSSDRVGVYECRTFTPPSGVGGFCAENADCTTGYCELSQGRCGSADPNLGAPCKWESDSDPDDECRAPFSSGLCWRFHCAAADDCDGYCVAMCVGRSCPAGTQCVSGSMPGAAGRCAQVCWTPDDCPLPELGCVSGLCRTCTADRECRAGLTCTRSSLGSACQ